MTMHYKSLLNEAINLEKEKDVFTLAQPFSHVVLDNFLSAQTIAKISDDFLEYDDDAWYTYGNAIEHKKALNNWNIFPPSLYELFSAFNSEPFLAELQTLSGISKLYADPGLHGGGLHAHKRGGKLNVHVDYSLHPKLNLERRLNLLIYVTPNWQPEWGGGLELWSHDEKTQQPAEIIKTIQCQFNRAVIFDTGSKSWHGLPTAIDCPDGKVRRSLALYYLSTPRQGTSTRQRALFVPSKAQQGDKAIEELIRKRSDVQQSTQVYRT